MQFRQLLEALKAKGRLAEAQRYDAAVTARFTGVLCREDVLELEVDAICQILDIASVLHEELCPEQSPLQAYIAEKQAEGFVVNVAEKYRKCLT
jgi:hypothetical protein